MLDMRTKPVTGDKVSRVSVERPEGSRTTLITPNWCDKTTWWYKSTKQTAQVLDHVSGYTVYESPTTDAVWVDNYHGKYSNEDFLLTEDGDVPRLKVYVNDVEKTEQDSHLGTGGDYTVNYATAQVTFLVALDSEDVVKVDAWEADCSCWVLKPATGKKIKIVSSEVQFSDDIVIKDTVKFQLYVWDGETMIPYGNPINYKCIMDYINEANGATPVIPKTTSTPGWRDIDHDIVTLPWNYQALTELGAGMEIRIELEHDEVFEGQVATATFYCLSYSL